VAQGKGRKDRYTLLSERLLEELRGYWRVYRPPAVAVFRDAGPAPARHALQPTAFTRSLRTARIHKTEASTASGMPLPRIC